MKIKIHKSYRLVVAVCDSDLIGKKFEEDDRILEINENFYGGKEVSSNELEREMADLSREDATFNIAGRESVETALKCGLISKEGVRKISGIPFALVLL